ncbi:tyrosine-type recombinase/integrase [Pantoea eucalypti]|uniref:tyrosine-type recombinase/integrase n=1 Tax=Pantoea eucalypti TaxID=470933 RepID=UPI00099ADF69|nr:tyrosine-type recombinase/integrase [Pantoea eucalypti]SJZ72702.1 Phage integrase family protein [Pantoea eucalypti]
MHKILQKPENQYSDFETVNGKKKVCFSDSIWSLDYGIKINFNQLIGIDKFLMLIKSTFAYCLKKHSVSYVRKMFFAIKHYQKEVKGGVIEFSYGEVANYFNRFECDNYTHSETMKYFLLKLNSQFPDLLDNSVRELIQNVRVKKPDAKKNVNTHDYDKGPFSDKQLNEIIRLSTLAFQHQQITFSNYLMLTLLIYSGRRPFQINLIQIQDVVSLHGKYFIDVPQIKQKNSYRQTFSKLEIPESLYSHLKFLSNAVVELVENTLSIKLSYNQTQELPVFISTAPFKTKKVTVDSLKNGDLVITSRQFASRIRWTVNKSIANSSINFGNINSRRFRYTLGTKAAEKGFCAAAIAKALDHTSSKSVRSYVHNNANNGAKINAIMNSAMIPIANLFVEPITFSAEICALEETIKEIKKTFADTHELIEIERVISKEMSEIVNIIKVMENKL